MFSESYSDLGKVFASRTPKAHRNVIIASFSASCGDTQAPFRAESFLEPHWKRLASEYLAARWLSCCSGMEDLTLC